MPAPLPLQKRKLTVLKCTEIHRGQGRNGAEYVMYEVEAIDESGKRIDQAAGGAPIRAFQELPIGELVEYEVQPKQTDRHGMTYTLKPPREPLWKRVQALEDRVDALEELLRRGQNPGQQSQPSTPASRPAPAPAAVAGIGDDADIPF